MSFEFLSDEWFAQVDQLIADAGDLQIPEAMSSVEVNVTVTSPGGETHLFMKNGLFERGHRDSAPTTITLAIELARKIFIDADAAAGVQAFMTGQMQVAGDLVEAGRAADRRAQRGPEAADPEDRRDHRAGLSRAPAAAPRAWPRPRVDRYPSRMSAYRPVPLDFERLPPDEMVARARAYADAMARRRTVRAFSPEPFPEEILRPRDPARRAARRRARTSSHGGSWSSPTPSASAGSARRRRPRRRRAGSGACRDEWLTALEPLGVDWHKPHLTDAPALIVVFAEPYGVESTSPTARARSSTTTSTSRSASRSGMLLSALHLAGLATLTHTPSPMEFLRELCGRPAHERPFVVIPVGYPAPGATVPDLTRKPLDEIMIQLGD